MLALKYVPRLPVVERFDVPFDKREILAIVFGVTACALLAGARRDVVSRMQPLAGAKVRANFGMAIQALERRLSTKFVATRAISRSIE